MDGLFRTFLISLLVARRTLLVFPLEFGLWLSLTMRWFSLSPLFSQVGVVLCALAKAFARGDHKAKADAIEDDKQS